MFIRLRRNEQPWEVVYCRAVEPVPSFHDDDDLDVLSISEAETHGTYVFDVRPHTGHHGHQLRRAVTFAQQQLLREVEKKGFDVLLVEGWRLTLLRKGKHNRVEVQYSARAHWMDAAPRPIHIHKPLLQCASSTDAPPPYWENDPNLRIMRYGPRTQRNDLYYCKGGVNVATLLRLTRQSLLEFSRNSGGNVLVDEKWHCTITKSIVRYRESFRVQISYSAIIAEAEGEDSQKVARIEDAKGIDGLMTVLERR
ncbi:hypothetical protein NP233_g3815 [Leucocoprinus birnbaumii]|uniref:Uncharacterized protein n=1 Tax=Leucocoprinus birnbaumii TaxID=56174 RepID=A0AAD5YY33_9AGAR|nr:hypothetical protein NP233_g3815 [Leucocoprinus birnbaumii]